MGYSAVNVGEFDLAAGADFITGLPSSYWVSSSFLKSDARYLFKPYHIETIAGKTIGITGVSSQPSSLQSDISFLDWHVSLPKVVAQLVEKTEFIILLSTLPAQDNEQIAAMFPTIRLIIASSPSRSNIEPRRMNNAIMTQTAYRGKYLGFISLKDIIYPYQPHDPSTRIDRLEHMIETFTNRIIKLEQDASDDKEPIIIGLKQRLQKLENEKEELTEIKNEQRNRTYCSFTSQFFALDDSISNNSIIDRIVEESK